MLSNHYIQECLNTIPKQLETGKSLSDIIRQQPFFQLRQQHLIMIGDQSGSLELALQHISQQCFSELNITLTHLSKLLEPVIMIGVALICGSCIVAMYLPIFNIGAII